MRNWNQTTSEVLVFVWVQRSGCFRAPYRPFKTGSLRVAACRVLLGSSSGFSLLASVQMLLPLAGSEAQTLNIPLATALKRARSKVTEPRSCWSAGKRDLLGPGRGSDPLEKLPSLSLKAVMWFNGCSSDGSRDVSCMNQASTAPWWLPVQAGKPNRLGQRLFLKAEVMLP